MLQFLKNKYLKYKEVINYLIFGFLTTLVNFIAYIVISKFIQKSATISNIIAWAISLVFAYITNRLYVFESKKYTINKIIAELISFVGCRLFSGILDIVSFYVLVDIVKINDILAKIIISIAVIILNYIFSKFIIFRKK